MQIFTFEPVSLRPGAERRVQSLFTSIFLEMLISHNVDMHS
jgi:hypothetical protein